MPKDLFYRLGNLIYRLRWLILFIWIGLIGICIPYLPHITDPFKAIGFEDPHSQSALTNAELNNKLGYSYNRFIIMYTSEKSFADNPDYLTEIKNSLKGLSEFPIEHQTILPSANKNQISKDKRAAYAVVLFKSKTELDGKALKEFKSLVTEPEHLTMYFGGEPFFLEDTKTQTQKDLAKAEYIGTPAAIITMLIVFGSVGAAMLPIVLGGIGVLLTLGTLYFLGHLFELSVFTINIALLLGLCLSLDYALLIINRFRDELAKGLSVIDAIAVTQATAAKSVFFSGLAVLISLSALLLFKINVLFSVGVGGLAAVTVAVAIAIILLPAILSLLKHHINWLTIPFLNRSWTKRSYWHWSVTHIIKRPLLFFIIILLCLFALGLPSFHAKIGISSFQILPSTLDSRKVFDIFKEKFGENKLEPILMMVETPQKNILTNKNISSLYDLGTDVKKDKRIADVSGIVNTDPRLSKKEYQTLYVKAQDHLPKPMKKHLDTTTDKNITVMTLTSKYNSNAEETTKLVENLREIQPSNNLKIQFTGGAVNTMDVKQSIKEVLPYAFLWIMGFTYLILLLFLRSVFLPLKAILTTLLSLFASYGVLVLVFQEGYLHNLLNFDPQGMLDISLLIIIFCALFGISMDYEVFLLTRIKEYYERTGNTLDSVVSGIERSSKIITSAAIIVIMLCFSFMAADILIVKAFGLGIAVAVFVDAFLIRTILVPATMALLGKLNWYLPKWLEFLPQISFDPEHYEPHTPQDKPDSSRSIKL